MPRKLSPNLSIWFIIRDFYVRLPPEKKHTMEYTVIIHKDEESGWYTGKCVQMPGAMSQGKTLDELIANMKDAISLMLKCYRDEARKAYAGEKFFYRKIDLA